MLYAYNSSGEKISPGEADNHEKGYCPLCSAKLIPKRGKINIWHWAHKRNITNCTVKPETEWHLRWKSYFPKENTEVIMEKKGEKRIADIVLNNGRVLELQHSSISPEEILDREAFYKKMAWIFDLRKSFEKENLSFIGKDVESEDKIELSAVKRDEYIFPTDSEYRFFSNFFQAWLTFEVCWERKEKYIFEDNETRSFIKYIGIQSIGLYKNILIFYFGWPFKEIYEDIENTRFIDRSEEVANDFENIAFFVHYWKWHKKTIIEAQKPAYFDIGDLIYRAKKNSGKYGYGFIKNKNDFIKKITPKTAMSSINY